MLRRRIEEKFLEWKQSRDKNPLIVKGCRQCGKTYSVLDFARKNYTNVVYINFFEKVEELGLDCNTDFQDKGHLNTSGAKKIANYIGKCLK